MAEPSYTLPPLRIPYPDPDPAQMDTDYPIHILRAHEMTNRMLGGFIWHFSPGSSGTISTVEQRLLSSQSMEFYYTETATRPAGSAVYATIELSAIAASIETTATNCNGYVRAELWDTQLLTKVAESQKIWICPMYQEQFNAKMPIPIENGIYYEIRIFCAARSATARFKLFESRFPDSAPINTVIRCTFAEMVIV